MATQEELILKQFASNRARLGQNRQTAQDQLKQGLQRRQAMGGLTGGAAIKAAAKAQKGLEQEYATQESELSGQEAEALRRNLAEKEAREFHTSERVAGQEFAASQASIDRKIQEEQFAKQYGLSIKQFDEMKRQFNQQFSFQIQELEENKKTNIINATIAAKNAGLTDPYAANKIQNIINGIYGRGSTNLPTAAPPVKPPAGSIKPGGGLANAPGGPEVVVGPNGQLGYFSGGRFIPVDKKGNPLR